MTDSEASKTPASSTPSVPPQLTRARWRRFGLPAIVILLTCVFAVFEGYGMFCRWQTVEQIKGWANGIPAWSEVTLKHVEDRLTGKPRRKIIDQQGTTRVIYTWPSLIGTYRVRALVRLGGTVVYLDTEPNESEEFMTPFLIVNENGVRVPQPNEPPPAHIAREVHANLIEESRTAFAQPKLALQPGLVIFPVVDQQGLITSTGAAISQTAQHSLVFTKQKRMALDPAVVRHTLADNRCWLPGTHLDQPKIDVCLKTIGVTAYALPRIEQRDGNWHIQVEVCRTDNDERVKLDLQAPDLNLVPGVIALGLFDHLKVPLSADERKWVAVPQFQTVEDAEEFSRIGAETSGTQDAGLVLHDRRLVPNPRWIAFWDFYLDRGNFGMMPRDPQVQLSLNLGQRGTANAPSTSHATYMGLLKLVPTLRGESQFQRGLVACARHLKDDALFAEMVQIWKAESNTYEARIARAQELLDSLPDDNSWAKNSVPLSPALLQLRQDRLQQAKEDLEQALALNPQGWEVYAELIRVADGLILPIDQIQAYFDNAIRLSPDNERAWRYIRRAMWTRDRVGLANADRVYRFANQCLDSGLWKFNIPHEVPDLLRGAAIDRESGALVYQQIQSPQHWQLIEKYYRLAQEQHLNGLMLRDVQACFAHDAAIGGHYAEAAPVFDLLDLPFQPPTPAQPPVPGTGPIIDPVSTRFGGQDQYARLRDLVRAKTRSGLASTLSAARAALIENRLADAEKLLQEAAPSTDEQETAELARLQRGLALGQRLAKERRVTLTAQEAYDLFAQIDQHACRGLRHDPRWKVRDNKLIWQYGGERLEATDPLQTSVFFPVGLRHGTISGQVNYDCKCVVVNLISHAQANRDPVILHYRLYEEGNIEMTRHGSRLEFVKLPPKPYLFKLNYGSKLDLLSPHSQYQWKTAVQDDSPGTLGVQIKWMTFGPALASLSDLTIEVGE